MSLEGDCRQELEAVLEDHFPEGVIGRGDAVAIFAHAMSLIHKTIKAFGGCESCYGKGYATSAEIGRRLSFCACDRGMQLERLIHGEEV
jgi:hypothetical protein